MSTEARSGTLMWVGMRNAKELRPIFQFCQENVSQIAVRKNLADALRRRADNVRCILLARHDRSPLDLPALDRLTAQHPDAKPVQLLGPLCTSRTASAQKETPVISWHRWNQSMVSTLSDCGFLASPPDRPVHSVAVVANSISAADPLLDVAVSAGAAAVWCRTPDTRLARNFDAVWWDDSVATPVSPSKWRSRLKQAELNSEGSPTHVWMTNLPHVDHIQAAQLAGVSVVLSKPTKIESLLATLGADQRQTTPSRSRLIRSRQSRAA